MVCNIDLEGEISPMMSCRAGAVQVNMAGFIYCAEVQDQTHAAFFLYLEYPVIPENFVRHHPTIYAGEQRLR